MKVCVTSELKTELKYEIIKSKIGARVYNTKEELASGVVAKELKDLLEERGIIVFPEIHFEDPEQIAFTKTMGTFMKEVGGQDVYNISLDEKMTQGSAYLKGSLFWHIDATMSPLPIGAAILSMKVMPTWGGNTEYCNTYAAYEALPEEEKAKIEGLRVVHSAYNSLFYYDPEPKQDMLTAMMAYGERELPLVWKHRSGRKSLVLGCTASHIVGMSHMESTKLLNGLREWAISAPFSYSHEWKLGDALMWDNTGTMHRAMPYDPNCGRLLHRTKTGGEEPIA